MNLIQSIESKIKLAFAVAIAGLLAGIVIATLVSIYAFQTISKERSQIYVLSNAIPLLATRSTVQDNRPAESKAAIEYYHNLFFCLPPDDNFIQAQMKKAMYLVDASGISQYNTLKEKGYFSSIVSSSSILTALTDSITVDMSTRSWRYYGKQKIERPSSITFRTLITEGLFKDIPRTEYNPFGVLIMNWKTIENKDISHEGKTTF